ncbi:VanZ family protein [Pseudoalteromonas rubra]|uniref:VanZ family protein n=1 Tax=Pseudoalteromonas rubra TaxID=43658 RepID=UPI00026CA805|nr:VanZ family protein [Pseudoalteromonas rubra]
MHKLVSFVAISFFLFIVWVIYLANTGQDSIFFDLVRSIPNGDKLGHIGLFGTLTVLFIVSFKFRSLVFGKVHIYYGAVIVLTLVCLEELSQAFISARTFDLFDMVANIVGILSGTVICHVGKMRFAQTE